MKHPFDEITQALQKTGAAPGQLTEALQETGTAPGQPKGVTQALQETGATTAAMGEEGGTKKKWLRSPATKTKKIVVIAKDGVNVKELSRTLAALGMKVESVLDTIGSILGEATSAVLDEIKKIAAVQLAREQLTIGIQHKVTSQALGEEGGGPVGVSAGI